MEYGQVLDLLLGTRGGSSSSNSSSSGNGSKRRAEDEEGDLRRSLVLALARCNTAAHQWEIANAFERVVESASATLHASPEFLANRVTKKRM